MQKKGQRKGMKEKIVAQTDREKGERIEMYAYYQQNGSNSLKATKAAL